MVSSGLMSSRQSSDSGGGSNYLCLPHNPEYVNTATNLATNRAMIYGTEYQGDPDDIFDMDNIVGGTFIDHNVPCTVCESNKTSVFMYPARTTCPQDWSQEYWGYLIAERSADQGLGEGSYFWT